MAAEAPLDPGRSGLPAPIRRATRWATIVAVVGFALLLSGGAPGASFRSGGLADLEHAFSVQRVETWKPRTGHQLTARARLRAGTRVAARTDGHTSACATITCSPSNVAAGDPYSWYPSANASLTRRQNAASSGPVRMR